jgi:hypothetical protein
VVNGTHYTFDVYGLYNGLFVMDDRQTGSVWTHYDGRVLSGPLAGQGLRLQIQPLFHTTWGEWLSLYPETTVLDWYPEFAARYREIEPGRNGLGAQFQRSLLVWDDRLAENELVLGVSAGGADRAYVLADFGDPLAVVNDVLGDVPLVVFVQASSTYALAFEAEHDDQRLIFRVQGGRILDEMGNEWDMAGRAISGPLQGARLRPVTGFVSEWYGWAAYHPHTSIYGR